MPQRQPLGTLAVGAGQVCQVQARGAELQRVFCRCALQTGVFPSHHMSIAVRQLMASAEHTGYRVPWSLVSSAVLQVGVKVCSATAVHLLVETAVFGRK